MRVDEAYQILGLANLSSFEMIKSRYRQLAKKYHPDVSSIPENSVRFTMISAAYATLEAYFSGEKNIDDIPDEVKQAAGIRDRIDKSFADISCKYRDYSTKRFTDLKQYIKSRIFSARNDSELHRCLDEDIKKRILDFQIGLIRHVSKIVEYHTSHDQSFLKNLFDDLYKIRKDYWLSTLHRDVVIQMCCLLSILWLIVNFHPQSKEPVQASMYYMLSFVNFKLAQISPIFESIILISWLPILVLIICFLYLLWNYRRINPGIQFIPPELTLNEIVSTLESIENGLGWSLSSTLLEHSIGFGATGATLGTFIAPGIGTAIGGAIGIVAGLVSGAQSGRTLDELKEEAYQKVIENLDHAMNSLNDRLEYWLEETRETVVQATEDSFAKNMKQISRLLANKRLLAFVTTTVPMLPSSTQQRK